MLKRALRTRGSARCAHSGSGLRNAVPLGLGHQTEATFVVNPSNRVRQDGGRSPYVARCRSSRSERSLGSVQSQSPWQQRFLNGCSRSHFVCESHDQVATMPTQSGLFALTLRIPGPTPRSRTGGWAGTSARCCRRRASSPAVGCRARWRAGTSRSITRSALPAFGPRPKAAP